ncbi:hypothetical protein FRC10_004975 [Ceratobasidium sp. 414]|nr:hypothetical protein FRC10_004975 [Ceratobasidium sp. 414]
MVALAWSALALAVARAAAQSAVAGIRIDDSKVFSDSTRDGIQLGSGWTADDADGKHYRGSYTSTQTTGSYLMLSFRGTSIAYYADKSPDSGTAILALDGRPFNATWLDQNVTTTVQRQQLMWSASGLSPGDHQLVLGTVASYINQTGTVGLDYFGITPVVGSETATPISLGPGSVLVSPNAVIVDNDDPSISYSDKSWRVFGPETNGPTPLYFNGTQRSSVSPGSSATFTFHGTDVWYFADDYWGNAKVSISVDGREGQIISTTTPGVAWITQKMWWSATGLTAGKHTVTVKHVGSSGDYANLDFFIDWSEEPAKTVPVGAIVGAVVGGVVLIGLIILGVFLYRRKCATKPAPEPTKEAGVHNVVLPHKGSQETLATLVSLAAVWFK